MSGLVKRGARGLHERVVVSLGVQRGANLVARAREQRGELAVLRCSEERGERRGGIARVHPPGLRVHRGRDLLHARYDSIEYQRGRYCRYCRRSTQLAPTPFPVPELISSSIGDCIT